MKKLACLFLLLAVGGCPDIQVDANETASPPVAEFDPANRIIPFPNNLLLDPVTGKVNLPAQCNEPPAAKALREGVLNQLDGFGLFEAAITVTFSEGVQADSLANRVVLYKRATGMTPADPAAAMPLPIQTEVGVTVRFDAACTAPSTVTQLAIVPLVPLEPKSVYVVALLAGIKTASGADFEPSFTWRLVRREENPVTVENGVIVDDLTPLDPSDEADRTSLLGIDLLWKAHAQGLAFLSQGLPADKRKSRDEILLAWEFKTQTGLDPLDPMVAGSLAASVNTLGLQGVASITGAATAEQFLQAVLPAGTCSLIPCAAVGGIFAGATVSKSYLSESDNPVAGTCMAPDLLGCKVRGQWADPLKPAVVGTENVVTFILTPAAGCPAEGCKTVIFAHALGRARTDVFAFAPILAAQGFAVVAIDAVAHGDRAIRVSNDAARGCSGARPSPLTAPQCFSPFLSTNLGTTRDNIRQTILDYHGLIAALKTCNATPCGGFKPDITKLHYIGQSLGGIFGGITVATASEFKSSVLNVPAVGWAEILENTAEVRIKCPLVDGLIDAKILTGEKSNLTATPPTGLCLTDAWKAQPGYRQFSVIGRWVLDAADPANFAAKLRTKKVLIQEVAMDTVMPNKATRIQGALLGLTATPAARAASTTPAPTPAVMSNTPRWVRYTTLPDDPATGVDDANTYHHGSLLSPQPPPPATDGRFGTAQMATDAITYLLFNP